MQSRGSTYLIRKTKLEFDGMMVGGNITFRVNLTLHYTRIEEKQVILNLENKKVTLIHHPSVAKMTWRLVVLLHFPALVLCVNNTFLSPPLLDVGNSFGRLDQLGSPSQCFKTQTQLICPGGGSTQSSTSQFSKIHCD